MVSKDKKLNQESPRDEENYHNKKWKYDNEGRLKSEYLDMAQVIGKYERENDVSEKCRITEWFGDYNLYEIKNNVSITEFMNAYSIATSQYIGVVYWYTTKEAMFFTDREEYVKCIEDEIEYTNVTGFKWRDLVNEPQLKKDISDILFNMWGEENPNAIEYYEKLCKDHEEEGIEYCQQTNKSEKEYTIEIRETLATSKKIKAFSLDEAIDKVNTLYKNEEIVLDAENLVDIEIENKKNIISKCEEFYRYGRTEMSYVYFANGKIDVINAYSVDEFEAKLPNERYDFNLLKVIDINKNVDISSVEELFVFIDALYEIKEKTRSSEIQEKIEIGINIAQGNHLYLENIIESWQPRNKIDEVYKEYMRYRVPRIIEQLKENKTIQNIQGIKYII